MEMNLSGTWAYSLQGLMYARNPKNLAPEKSREAVTDRGKSGNTPTLLTPLAIDASVMWPLSLLTLFRLTLRGPLGFHPVTEIGHMTFTPDPAVRLKGTVSGELRLNVAGMGDAGEYKEINGSYVLLERVFRSGNKMQNEPDMVPLVTTGAITVSWTDAPGVKWDYSLIFDSADSAQITAGGRMPRPGVLLGNMRRLPQ